MVDLELDKIKKKKLDDAMKKKAETAKEIPTTEGKPHHLTDQDFNDTIKTADIALVDFYADWCGPCKMMAPTIDLLAKEYSGKVLIAKVNVDKNPVVSQKYGITSIPTFGIFKKGKTVGTVIGAVGKEVLKGALDKAIRSG